MLDTPFGPHVDIRDTVNYREVMKQYSLGPNGGILTALNLFATKLGGGTVEPLFGALAREARCKGWWRVAPCVGVDVHTCRRERPQYFAKGSNHGDSLVTNF